MRRLGLERDVVDPAVYERTVERFKERRIALPELRRARRPEESRPDGPGRARRGRPGRRRSAQSLPGALAQRRRSHRVRAGPRARRAARASSTGVRRASSSPSADRFPMIGAHKVLASYGCLAPRVVTGQFDPTATAPSGRRLATTAEAASRSRG